ncbi:MAG: ATP-dependent zinc metalloprotease FtsH [Anaerolineae bacterium]|nr:ATP-dependent zinc metalloprotease FtsH [Anaerolineae bacterium]
MNASGPNPNSKPPTPRPTIPLFWWIILIVLFIWNIWTLKPQVQQTIAIPYTTFIQQIKNGNVTEVQINGTQIDGTFQKGLPAADLVPPDQLATSPAATQPVPTSQAPATPTLYTSFTTTFPEAVGDPNLVSLLEANNVTLHAQAPSNPFLVNLLINALPFILFIGLMIWMGRQSMKSQSGILNFGQSKARQYNEERPQVTFMDVAGAEEAKEELSEVVEFLRNPQKYHDIGARIPRGVLLVGPPGTGKTLLARAVAGEAKVPFYTISASEFVEMFVGVGASRVRNLFEHAKATSPSIVFIDELDAVGRRRGAGLGAVNDEREQTLNQLLVEMDGFDDRNEVIIIAATNRPDVLDPALLRPGRFDREITVGLPDRKGREGILKIHSRSLRLAPNVDLLLMARSTTGFSGADLANLCNEAALIAAREGHEQVGMNDFEEALDRILLGAARSTLLNDHDRKVVAYHEAGHAVAAWLLPNADPVHKVTIIPRGRALGVTEQLPGEDQVNYSREYLLARIAVMLGGRVAEELAIGDITTGAENDLTEATRLARRMITRWGMGDLGLMTISSDEEQPFLGYEISQGRNYSEETSAQIDRDIQKLLNERHEQVRGLLTHARNKLDQLVDVLLREETVTQDELTSILGSRILEPS